MRAVMYTASISVILAAIRICRSLKDIPGFRVFTILFEKAGSSLKVMGLLLGPGFRQGC